jgi:hypothetical protein
VQVRARHITLPIHLWLMIGNGTCYSVFIATRSRKKVLSIRAHLCNVRWNLPSLSVSHVRWISCLTSGAPIKPLNPAH